MTKNKMHSHYASAEEIAEMNKGIIGENRLVASLVGTATDINKWVAQLAESPPLDSFYSPIRWTYEKGVVHLHFWGGTIKWRALMHLINEKPNPKVTIARLIDWELASKPNVTV